MQIISVYYNLRNRGGAQNVMLSIAESIHTTPVILTSTSKKNIHSEYNKKDYIIENLNIFTILKYRKCIFISHDRKSTTKLILLNKLFKLNLRIIHVAHNVFNSKKRLTLFPETIIAVSNSVKKNLIDYFGITDNRIKVIYNGIEDKYKKPTIKNKNDTISILLPARICKIKRQLDIVQALRDNIPQNIIIYFAGNGEDQTELSKIVSNKINFKYLGNINLSNSINDFDYIMLFSIKEGLPLSLIEGCMYGKPLISNNLDSCLEVNENEVTGYVFSNLDELKQGLKNLPSVESDEYTTLSSNARSKYLKLFTKERMIQEYKECIANIYSHK